jgi:hypothetical protein
MSGERRVWGVEKRALWQVEDFFVHAPVGAGPRAGMTGPARDGVRWKKG